MAPTGGRPTPTRCRCSSACSRSSSGGGSGCGPCGSCGCTRREASSHCRRRAADVAPHRRPHRLVQHVIVTEARSQSSEEGGRVGGEHGGGGWQSVACVVTPCRTYAATDVEACESVREPLTGFRAPLRSKRLLYKRFCESPRGHNAHTRPHPRQRRTHHTTGDPVTYQVHARLAAQRHLNPLDTQQ